MAHELGYDERYGYPGARNKTMAKPKDAAEHSGSTDCSSSSWLGWMFSWLIDSADPAYVFDEHSFEEVFGGTMNSDQWVKDNSRAIAKSIVRQWDKHDKFRTVAGEDSSEPNEVVVARALLRIDQEYGCEVMDPAGTIWDHAANITQERDKLRGEVGKLRALLLGVLENDEAAEGFNNANLGDLRQQIRDAVAFKI